MVEDRGIESRVIAHSIWRFSIRPVRVENGSGGSSPGCISSAAQSIGASVAASDARLKLTGVCGPNTVGLKAAFAQSGSMGSSPVDSGALSRREGLCALMDLPPICCLMATTAFPLFRH